MLGLPEGVTTCLFDLDGVLTQTATVHCAAWASAFDALLHRVSEEQGTPFAPFDQGADYNTYVDGKPRADGVRDFLASRGIHLPEGDPDDPPSTGPGATVHSVGNAKNVELLQRIEHDGVEVYDGSRRYLDAAAAAGLGRIVVSSSANTAQVLEVTGLDRLVEGRIDGVVARERSLPGKPAPDTYLAGAELAGVDPSAAAVFEDALSGVEAGRAGHFGFVVGVDRVGQAAALSAHGADRVVRDLAELLDEPDREGGA